MTKKTKRILGVVTLLGLTGAFVAQKGCFSKKEILVAVEEVALHDIIETVPASGKIYPVSEVKISPDVSGEIIDLYVEEGDSVRRGQVLATINSTTYRSMVNRANAQLNQTKSTVSNANAITQQAKAQLEQAKATFDRNKKLYDEQVISAAEFEQAMATFKSAQANYKAAMESIKGNQYGVASAEANVNEAMQNLRKTTLYAPMSGIISKLFVKKGERVVGTMQMAGTELMRVADMSKMKVDVEVGENDITKVKYGDTAMVDVDAYPNRKFKGVVAQISQSSGGSAAQQAINSMSEQVTNYTVSIELLPSSYDDLLHTSHNRFPFRPGMSASVEIRTQYNMNVISVPINAVTTRDDADTSSTKSDEIKEYVFVLNTAGAVELREIKTSVQDNLFIQVVSGLKVKEKVVVAPFKAIVRTLKNKDNVKVVPKNELYESGEDADMEDSN